MINIEQAVDNKFPTFANQPSLIRKPTLSFLRKLVHEDEINQFLEQHKHARGFGFIDKVFEHFDFSYSTRASDRKNIPALGRVVIFANHPIGSLECKRFTLATGFFTFCSKSQSTAFTRSHSRKKLHAILWRVDGL